MEVGTAFDRTCGSLFTEKGILWFKRKAHGQSPNHKVGVSVTHRNMCRQRLDLPPKTPTDRCMWGHDKPMSVSFPTANSSEQSAPRPLLTVRSLHTRMMPTKRRGKSSLRSTREWRIYSLLLSSFDWRLFQLVVSPLCSHCHPAN